MDCKVFFVLQFWEKHFETLVFLHVDIVGGHYAIPDNLSIVKNPEDIFNKFKRNRQERKLRSHSAKSSDSRKRINREEHDLKTKSLIFSQNLKIEK